MLAIFEFEFLIKNCAMKNLSPKSSRHYPSIVKWWLIIGLILIFVQVVVGGITRLTGSGLSITKWEIIQGTIPPLTNDQWITEFDFYKQTPQYQKINDGMSLSDFKFIYFWEYFHRLWARMMGFVFIIPLAYFLIKGYIDKALGKRLLLVFLSAALTASFGWIMVASGLIDRPLVNAYKLSMHLGIAFITYAILLWITFWTFNIRVKSIIPTTIKKWTYLAITVLCIQILLGGMMSGMKAALFYPTWPDMNGMLVPGVIVDPSNWTLSNFIHYDSHPFMTGLVQFLHRFCAYLLSILVVILGIKVFKASWDNFKLLKNAQILTLALLATQVILGIITLIYSKGSIPVLWGVLHQGVALLLLSALLFQVWLVKSN